MKNRVLIDSCINKLDTGKVANACNVIASMENLDTINPEDMAYNYIAQMFLEPVLVKYHEQVMPNV